MGLGKRVFKDCDLTWPGLAEVEHVHDDVHDVQHAGRREEEIDLTSSVHRPKQSQNSASKG